MKIRSRFMAGMLMAAVAGGVALPTNNANAIVGLLTGNPGLAIVGLAMAVTGDVVIANADKYYNPRARRNFGANLMGLGIIFLDGKGSQAVAFQPVDAKEANALGVSWDDAIVYNAELDELNSVREQALGNVNTYAESHAGMKRAEAAKMISSEWLSYGKALSPETMRVAGAIATRFVDSK